MKLCDLIAEFINARIEEQGSAELCRAELAARFACVPSSVNYVISSRFTPELGYTVESRRGGGGYIRITRCAETGSCYLMHVVNAVGENIDAASCRAMLANMSARGVLDSREAALLSAATEALPAGLQGDRSRAAVFKNMLLSLASV